MAFYPYEINGTKVNYNSIEPEDISNGRVAVPFKVDKTPVIPYRVPVPIFIRVLSRPSLLRNL